MFKIKITRVKKNLELPATAKLFLLKRLQSYAPKKYFSKCTSNFAVLTFSLKLHYYYICIFNAIPAASSPVACRLSPYLLRGSKGLQ